MLPQEIFTDHIRPFLDPEVVFQFIKTWEHDDKMIVVLRWLFNHGLMDPYYVSASKWNLLSWACYHNHQEMIGLLLDMKINLYLLSQTVYIYISNTFPTIDFNMDAMDIVCYYNRLEILKKLVAYDPSIVACTNLHYACEMDHTKMCEFLVQQAIPLDPNLFLPICRHNNIHLFRLFMEKGCPLTHRYISRRTLLMYACMHECLEIVRELIQYGVLDINEQDDHGNTALMYVCHPLSMSHHEKNRISDEDNKLQIVKLLVEHGVHINLQKKNGLSALFIAFQHDYYLIATYLLEKGANINVQDHSGWNCLMYACYDDNYQAAQQIVAYGVDLEQKNRDGMNALMFACRYKRHNIFDLILEQCDGHEYLDTQDVIGYTALMWACVNRPDPYMIRTLVRKGADISLKTIHGSTALNLAYEYGLDDHTLAMLMP
jgi:ankyrin repeat protein